MPVLPIKEGMDPNRRAVHQPVQPIIPVRRTLTPPAPGRIIRTNQGRPMRTVNSYGGFEFRLPFQLISLFPTKDKTMKKVLVAVASVCLLTAAAFAADAIKLDGVNCVVASNKAAKEGNSVEYKGGKVFFCCMNCPKAFAKDTAKYATSANKQLVATGQAKQIACPYSGKHVAEGTEIKVGGVEVGFCCNNCKGKTEKASAEEATEMVFNDKAFEKGFKVGAAK